MPYITPQRRAIIDNGGLPSQRPLDSSVIPGDGLLNAGELTYVLQQTCKNYLTDRGLTYGVAVEVLGALEGCKADFINRVLTPYEEGKRVAHGDVWGNLGRCKDERPA